MYYVATPHVATVLCSESFTMDIEGLGPLILIPVSRVQLSALLTPSHSLVFYHGLFCGRCDYVQLACHCAVTGKCS